MYVYFLCLWYKLKNKMSTVLIFANLVKNNPLPCVCYGMSL